MYAKKISSVMLCCHNNKKVEPDQTASCSQMLVCVFFIFGRQLELKWKLGDFKKKFFLLLFLK